MERIQKTRQAAKRTTDQQAEPVPSVATNKAHEYTDEVLADIDEALEGLEWDLAIKFRQKGGE